MKITIKSVLFGVIGRVIPRNLRVFTFEKREIRRFGCISEVIFSAKPNNLSDFGAKSAPVQHFWVLGGRAGGSLHAPVGGVLGSLNCVETVGIRK